MLKNQTVNSEGAIMQAKAAKVAKRSRNASRPKSLYAVEIGEARCAVEATDPAAAIALAETIIGQWKGVERLLIGRARARTDYFDKPSGNVSTFPTGDLWSVALHRRTPKGPTAGQMYVTDDGTTEFVEATPIRMRRPEAVIKARRGQAS